MILIDAIVRFSGIGFLVLLAMISVRDFRQWHGTLYLVLACISLSALFLGYAPHPYRPTGLLYQVVRILDVPHLIFVWLFVLCLFDSDFSPRWQHLGIGVLYCLPILWLRFASVSDFQIPIIYLVSGFSFLLMAHLCVSTLKGFRDDLLEQRRKSRLYFVVIISIITCIAATSEVLLTNASTITDYTVKIISLWIAIAWATYWMLSFRSASVLFGKQTATIKMSALDKGLEARLTKEMEVNHAYKNSDMTIVSLAKTLGVTQHRLRAFINQSLGYANFRSFVNMYKLRNVKQALLDPKNEDQAIISIAIDAGFNSLSSFNRIFKLSEGLTPSAYRTYHQSK